MLLPLLQLFFTQISSRAPSLASFTSLFQGLAHCGQHQPSAHDMSGKLSWDRALLMSLWIVSGCFCAPMAELKSCDRGTPHHAAS